MNPIISIGLEPHVVDAIKKEAGHIVVHDVLPKAFALNGQVKIESPSVYERYLTPRAVLYYCYFEDPQTVRRALALSNTPTFPDVKKTILHDDKVLSLIQAINADDGPSVLRGFADDRASLECPIDIVAKWGVWHCGEGKKLCDNGLVKVPEPSVLEPFIKGESLRILQVGDSFWQLHYSSDDWRKNVNSKITVLKEADSNLTYRTYQITKALGLLIAGVDYIINDDGAYLLEVNAYPGLDDVPEAEEKFIQLAVGWIKEIDNGN